MLTFLAQPYERCCKVQEAEVASGKLVKAREDAAVLLDLVDEAFDQVALSIQMSVKVASLCSVLAGRNDRNSAHLLDLFNELVGVIASVSDYEVGFSAFDESRTLGHVMGLSSSEQEVQGIAQGIHAGVDLGAEATSAAT